MLINHADIQPSAVSVAACCEDVAVKGYSWDLHSHQSLDEARLHCRNEGHWHIDYSPDCAESHQVRMLLRPGDAICIGEREILIDLHHVTSPKPTGSPVSSELRDNAFGESIPINDITAQDINESEHLPSPAGPAEQSSALKRQGSPSNPASLLSADVRTAEKPGVKQRSDVHTTHLRLDVEDEENDNDSQDSMLGAAILEDYPSNAGAISTSKRGQSENCVVGTSSPGSAAKPYQPNKVDPTNRSPNVERRIFFASSSTVKDAKNLKKFLVKSGVNIVDSLFQSNTLCVGKCTELKRTPNLNGAIVLGNDVITDDWVVDCARQGTLLDMDDYCAKDPQHEREWGVTLREAIKFSRQGVQPLSGYDIFFTKSAIADMSKENFSMFKDILEKAGATLERTTMPKTPATDPPTRIVVAVEGEDTKSLDQLYQLGYRTYSKDVMTFAILRGHLELNNPHFMNNIDFAPEAVSSNKHKTREKQQTRASESTGEGALPKKRKR